MVEIRSPFQSVVISHTSGEFVCRVAPFKTVRFKLVLKIRRETSLTFELYMESLEDEDLRLRLACAVRSNNFNRTKRPFDVTVPGKVEGNTQHESIMWGQISDVFGEGQAGGGGGQQQNISLPDVKVSVNIFTTVKYPRPKFLEEEEDGETSLSTDMEAAFNNEVGANLTIICMGLPAEEAEGGDEGDEGAGQTAMEQQVERARFRVQQGVLAARSEVFAAMFSRGFREQEEATVTIGDMSPEALREFLRFMYTDKPRQLGEHAEELLAAADKYNVARLKLLCEQALCEELSDDRVSKVAILAETYNAERAREFALVHLVDNFPDVLDKESWKELASGHGDLLAEVHRRLAGKMEQMAKRQVVREGTTRRNDDITIEALDESLQEELEDNFMVMADG